MKWSSNQNLKLKEAFLADDHPPKKAQICFPTDNPKKHESFFWTFPKDNPDIRMGSASSPAHRCKPALHHQKYSWQVEGEEGEGEDQHCYQQLKKCYF